MKLFTKLAIADWYPMPFDNYNAEVVNAKDHYPLGDLDGPRNNSLSISMKQVI